MPEANVRRCDTGSPSPDHVRRPQTPFARPGPHAGARPSFTAKRDYLQQPSQGPSSQQQHVQFSHVQVPFTQQPQQSQSGQPVFATVANGARRASVAQVTIAYMVIAP